MFTIFTKIFLLFLLISTSAFPQLAKDSWSFGFGGTYPRMISLSEGAWSGIKNYGGYLTLQRNVSEHVALRFLGNFSHMETDRGTSIHSINLLATDFDMLYYLVPCEDFTPYLSAGFGGIIFSNDNSLQSMLDVTYLEYQFNLGLGAEWKFSDDWSLKAEGIYHTSSTNKLDGFDDPGEDKGLFGGNSDTYVTLNLGLQYYFYKGEPSTMCNLYDGLTVGAPPDFSPSIEEIEDLIKKYSCKEVIKEVVVEKPVEVPRSQWVLVGVNFASNSAQLTDGSYSILYGAVQYLNQYPELKIEIQGHTDNVGSEKLNQQLSERRANTVRDYLVSKGISSSRLIAKGYGESSPVGDNSTSEGRSLNRRIEFKVVE